MEKFTDFTGVVAPLDRVNVDTDQIIPKQFLKKIERTGFGIHLFHDWRFTDDAGQKENPDFVLNQDPWRSAPILLAGDNFGCGSSREHAPWALNDYGIKVIISTSFADIFYQNSIKNGMLPIVVSEEDSKKLFDKAQAGQFELQVSLTNNKITGDGFEASFELAPAHKEALLEGIDEIAATLKYEQQIKDFETEYDKKYPFLNNRIARTVS